MILVDTCVWSEALRSVPDERVAAWARANTQHLYLSAVVAGELLSGVEMMPTGRKRTALEQGYTELIRAYADRVIAFDLDAARHYATLVATQVRAGRDPGTADLQIAATALAHGMSLATRNVRDFSGLELNLIDPWND